MRLFVLLVAGLVLLAGVSATVPGGGTQAEARWVIQDPRTLVGEQSAILAFAQDDQVLAWQVDAPDTSSAVKVRVASGARVAVISKPDGGDADIYFDAFGLGGTRVVWAGFTDCCNSGYGEIETAAPGSQPKTLRALDLEYWSWGDYPTGAAGDGRTLVYSLATISSLDEQEDWRVTGGGVWRVIGAKSDRIPGTPPTALLAAAHGKIALVPADRRRYRGPCSDENSLGCPEVRVAQGARVEIRDAITGGLQASFVPRGRVAALGMDAETVVAMIRSSAGTRVEWYSAKNGKLVGSSAVASDVSDEIDVSAHTIVIRRGKTILAIDTATRRLRELARSRARPVGLSIEGTRVAWADGAAIQAVDSR